MSATESLLNYQRNYNIALSMGCDKEIAKKYAATMAAGTYETLGQNLKEIK